jgi:hypothetical protein
MIVGWHHLGEDDSLSLMLRFVLLEDLFLGASAWPADEDDE